MLPSPYAPGSLPMHLAGRGVELATVRDRVARMAMLGRSGGPLLAFQGSRGLGKTSLLRQAQRDALDAGHLTVWATGRDDARLGPELARALAEELRRRSLGERAKALLSSLDRVAVELGVPGARVEVEVGSEPQEEAVERTLGDAGRFARDHELRGLVVFVDELQETRLADRRSLLIALQHFDGAPEGCPVTVVAAGLPSLLGAVPEAATFGERTEFVELGSLADVAVAEALRLPAEELGVGWSDEAVLEGVGLAAGYPHQVQLVGEAAWRVARPEVGGRVEVGDVRQGAEQAQQRMVTLFRSRLVKLTSEQRGFVEAMAGSGDGPVGRRDLARRLGVTSEALSRVRQELIGRGIVEPAGRGLLRFTIPGFAAHLRTDRD